MSSCSSAAPVWWLGKSSSRNRGKEATIDRVLDDASCHILGHKLGQLQVNTALLGVERGDWIHYLLFGVKAFWPS